MKVKNIPRYISLGFLIVGASCILGFLSFSGMFALWPIIPLALASLTLSVAYEGEIYRQNLSQVWKRLFKPRAFEHELGREFLLDYFPADTSSPDCPQFFKDYEKQLKLLHRFEHKELDEASLKRKRHVEKTLKDMEKWFAKQLYSEPSDQDSNYQKDVRAWVESQIEHRLGREYLLQHFPADLDDPQCPQFFRDYAAQRERQQYLLLDIEQREAMARRLPNVRERRNALFLLRAERKQAQQPLEALEKRFARLLYLERTADNEDAGLPWAWFNNLPEAPNKDSKRYTTELERRKYRAGWARGFSVLAGVFIGLSTTYLLVEAFSIIPFLAAISFTTLPYIIIPMAMVAGLSYALLSYNAWVDVISHNPITEWCYKIFDDVTTQPGIKSVIMSVMALALFALTITLTVCTMGTWWTVVNNTRPLFSWMAKLPVFIMGVINPIITGIATFIFNIQNTSESLEMIDALLDTTWNQFTSWCKRQVDFIARVFASENWMQVFNPFRLILKLTITPLRILLFLGHLISIGVTADRMPGLSEILTAILGIISEGFEDAHYFMGDTLHQHSPDEDETPELLKERLGAEAGHDHSLDLPTQVLKLVFWPVYFAATLWDWGWSKLTQATSLSWEEAEAKQYGTTVKQDVDFPADFSQFGRPSPYPSPAWQTEHAVMLVERHEERLGQTWHGQAIAEDKRAHLGELHTALAATKDTTDKQAVQKVMRSHKRIDPETGEIPHMAAYNRHRMFSLGGPSETAAFVDNLEHRIRPTMAAAG